MGNCTIAGTYTGGGSSQISFVVTDSNGLLSPVTALPMPTNQLSAGQYSQPHDISCTTDTCVVVGTYQTAATGTEGFISTVRNQVGTTVQLRLPTARNLKPQVAINQVNCWGSGACVAVGSYVDANGVGRAFGVSSANGVWGVAQPITLPVNASAYAAATLLEVTCSTASACTAVGTYLTSTGARVPFGVSFTNGVWAQASTISLPKDAATSPSAYLWGFRGLSCPTTGNCSFGGDYTSTSGLRQGFLVNESGGTWQSATTLPLPTGAKQAGANGGVIAVSCPAPGTCTAAAAFIDAQNQYQAEVVSETNNVWSRPTQLTLPNRATSVGVDGGIYGIACFPTSGCALVGTYLNGRLYQGFSAQA